jgi:hypothetical protein
MTPKEKAKELIEKFNNIADIESVWDGNKWVTSYDHAKQCALICVDEILNSVIVYSSELLLINWSDEQLEYWLKVKQEIENYE